MLINIDEVVEKILQFVDYEYMPEFDGHEEGIANIEIGIMSIQTRLRDVLNSTDDLLGKYVRMAYCKGTIILYLERIGGCFWSIMESLASKSTVISVPNLRNLAKILVTQVYTHEQFHHFTDVCRCAFERSHVFETEEAMAVAYSRQKIGDMLQELNSQSSLPPYYNEFVEMIFDYQSRGYKDWRKYQQKIDFDEGLIKYIGPKDTPFLLDSGIHVESILWGINRSLHRGEVEERLE